MLNSPPPHPNTNWAVYPAILWCASCGTAFCLGLAEEQSSLQPEAKLCKWLLEGRIPAPARGFQALLGRECVMEKAALVCVLHLAY